VTFQTIVADPPWSMKRGSQYSWREGRASGERQELDYETMTVEQIAAIDVPSVAAADAHLLLWVTGTFLPRAFEVVEAWGFSYSQTLVWSKRPRGWAPGGVFQSTAEFIIYARRGKPEPRTQQVDRQVFEWARGEHSAKPEPFMDMVERVFPAPRLELFARRARLGWETAGNESLASVRVQGIAS
jgi:N6-adenosine-specific RNA methylase IME4